MYVISANSSGNGKLSSIMINGVKIEHVPTGQYYRKGIHVVVIKFDNGSVGASKYFDTSKSSLDFERFTEEI